MDAVAPRSRMNDWVHKLEDAVCSVKAKNKEGLIAPDTTENFASRTGPSSYNLSCSMDSTWASVSFTGLVCMLLPKDPAAILGRSAGLMP